MIGATEKRYAALLWWQENRCEICHRPPKTVALAWDHDHATGRPRGLLCFRCNRLLLQRGVTAELLELAAIYLGAWKHTPC